jgi:hypothetical protein
MMPDGPSVLPGGRRLDHHGRKRSLAQQSSVESVQPDKLVAWFACEIDVRDAPQQHRVRARPR